MPGYGNYNVANYANNGNNFNGQNNQNTRQNAGYNYYGNNGYNNGYNQTYQDNQPQMIDSHFQWVDYVSGRAGADAYQLPNNVNRAILFDNDSDRFFIKGYDNSGRPRVLDDNDFQDHVEPEPVVPNIDLTPYATKEDIKQMIADAFGNYQAPNMAGYLTKREFNKALSELSVGNGGKIVRTNEQNA